MLSGLKLFFINFPSMSKFTNHPIGISTEELYNFNSGLLESHELNILITIIYDSSNINIDLLKPFDSVGYILLLYKLQ